MPMRGMLVCGMLVRRRALGRGCGGGAFGAPS